MMECRNCTAELRESEAIPAGEKRLNHNSVEEFFYIRCPVCGKLMYCKRIVVTTDMEVEREMAEIRG